MHTHSHLKTITGNAVQITEPHQPVLTGKARSFANLKPWKKGESGGGGGRPKTANLRDNVLKFYHQDPEGCIKRLYAERIDLFFAYGFGKPVDRLELSAPDLSATQVHETSAGDSVKALAIMGIVLPGA